jgi:hypothetical protein
MYSHNDLKPYKGGSPYFKDLPPEVKEILIHKFTDLLADNLTTIARYDPLEVPNTLQLMDLETGEPVKPSEKNEESSSPVVQESQTEDEDIQNYLNEIEREGTLQDIKDMQLENPDDPTRKLFNQADIGSDDSDEENDENDDIWAGRLRNRKGKTVRYA